MEEREVNQSINLLFKVQSHHQNGLRTLRGNGERETWGEGGEKEREEGWGEGERGRWRERKRERGGGRGEGEREIGGEIGREISGERQSYFTCFFEVTAFKELGLERDKEAN